ncbi:hypothetical protein BJ170DRAFT_689818 [Xylariales sp. AK1849]|nr:hypothetical protein BJ170DRAFT_689818 [Xylariales sp. AK1849]
MLSTSVIFFLSSFVLAANSQSIYHPDCDWEPPHRTEINGCQNAIGKAIFDTNGHFKTGWMYVQPQTCSEVAVDSGCALNICSKSNVGWNVPWGSIAMAAQDIMASCRASFDQGTAGTIDTTGLSDQNRIVPFTVTLGRVGTVVTRQSSGDVGAGNSSNVDSDLTERATTIATDGEVLLPREDPPSREVRPGLTLELVMEQGDHHGDLDRGTMDGVEDYLRTDWPRDTGDTGVTSVVARANHLVGDANTQFALVYAAERGYQAQDLPFADRFHTLEVMQQFYRDRGCPRLFAVRVLKAGYPLGWLAWNVVDAARLML